MKRLRFAMATFIMAIVLLSFCSAEALAGTLTWSTAGAPSGAGFNSVVDYNNLLCGGCNDGHVYCSNGGSWSDMGLVEQRPVMLLACDGGRSKLYAACGGDVWQYAGPGWTQLTGLGVNLVTSLYVDEQYGGLYTGCENGHVFSYYNGSWWDMGYTGGTMVRGLYANITFQGVYFAGCGNGHVYKWIMPLGWVDIGAPDSSAVDCLIYDYNAPLNNAPLNVGYADGHIYSGNGSGNWSDRGLVDSGSSVNCIDNSSSNLLLAGCGDGHVYTQVLSGGSWKDTGDTGGVVHSLAWSGNNIVNSASDTAGIMTASGAFQVITASIGSGIVPGGGSSTYGLGEDVEIMAHAYTHSVFDHWEGDLSGNTNPIHLTMDETKRVTAVFVPVAQHAVNASVSSGKGTLSPLTQLVYDGDPATVRISAERGFRLNSLRDNGVEVSPLPSGGYTIGNVTSDHSVVAQFASTLPVISSISPDHAAPGSQVTVTGSNFGDTQGSSTITIGGLPAGVVSWSDTKIVVTVPVGASSGAVVVTTSQGGSNTNKVFTLVYPTWYLAEGTTAWGFNTYITIENPNAAAVTAKITYMDPNPVSGKGRVFPPRTITLPAMSQTTVDPRWDLGDTDFSTRVDCLQGKTIAVDRTMFWTGPGAPSPEGHNSVGTSSPARTWYLPEGSSAWNFETWTLVENPNAQDAHITLTYMVQGGGPRTLSKTVPAYSRATYNMASDLGTQADASVKITSDAPVIAEQSMYRNNRREGSCSIGANTPATDYFLAEGTTAWGFDTYVLVQNPNPTPTDVTITCMTPKGPVALPSFRMDPNSRETTLLNHWLPDTDLSVQVHGTQPIIAERSMYWGAGTPLGEAMHASVGLEGPRMTFYLPDGQTSNGYETYTLVQTPNPGAVRVQVSYLPQGGGKTVTFTDELAPNSRKTYSMGDKIPSGRASVVVQSLDGARPIKVERSMYWNHRGAGTNTIGGFSD